jgi:outer membrane protein TolC
MKRLAILAAVATAALAQTRWFDRVATQYRAPAMPAVSFDNSPRIATLVRAGILYLSLEDAIALVIENNLDVEFERFAPPIADTDFLRASGGGTLRGISLVVAELPAGIGGPASPLLNAAASGSLPGTSVPSNLTVLSAITPGQSGIVITGAAPLSLGPPIPQFDPSLTAGLFWQRQNTPEVSISSSGNSTLSATTWNGNLGVVQGFSTGAQVNVAFTGVYNRTNAVNFRLNPFTTSSLSVNLVQPLLRGFGSAVNRRFIRIARNNRLTSDLLFREQLIATVAGAIRLYEDLVSLDEDVRVKEDTLALAERLYQDNRVQVEQGTLAPVELTRAQAQVAASQQDLANSRGFERQQELILLNVLTRRGTADSGLRDVRVRPTTPIDVPAKEPVRPVPDMVAEALRIRPEMKEARLQIDNSYIALEGSRNALLPELDLVATGLNAALAGQPKSLAELPPALSAGLVSAGGPVGGFGESLAQIFTGTFPTYSIGVQLTLPLRNRIAQADVARDQIQIRQWDIRRQQLENQIRLEVEASVVALGQARVAYDAAVQARMLQEQSLAIEMEKYAVGLSTTFLVMQYQSFVAQARSTEVAARNIYVKARIALERAIGTILEDNGVSVDQALRGKVGH